MFCRVWLRQFILACLTQLFKLKKVLGMGEYKNSALGSLLAEVIQLQDRTAMAKLEPSNTGYWALKQSYDVQEKT